ncbi:hypothetical protein [Lysinibacillus sp. TE18511]
MEKLIFETMDSYNQYLQNLIIASERIAENLRNENMQNALHLILQFSEGMNWLIDVNMRLTELGYPQVLLVEQIHEYLHEINDGLEIQDYILVADMFEYEIKSFFENVKPYEVTTN